MKIEPRMKLNHNIYMSVPSRLPFGRAMRAFISGLKGGKFLRTIISWKPYYFRRKGAWPHLFYGKGFQDVQVTTIFSMSLDLNRKMLKLKQHTVFAKHCEHLKIIRMQNLKQQLLEICFIIKVMTAQTRIFLHFCAVVLLFFVKTVIACFGL